MIELVIFDLDGVITESSKQHFEAWKALATELMIPFNQEDNEALKGISRFESLEIILSKDPHQRVFTPEGKNALMTKKNDLYVKLIMNFTKKNLFEGVEELLFELKEKGIKIALASASKNAPFLLKRLGIEDYFDYVVNPADLAKGKPDPEIFLNAAKVLEVACENAIGIEDAQAGVQSIKGAGMFAIGIGDKTVLKEADLIVEHIREVKLSEICGYFNQATGV